VQARQHHAASSILHACDVASASRAAVAFHEVGTARSVRPARSGQSLRRARMLTK